MSPVNAQLAVQFNDWLQREATAEPVIHELLGLAAVQWRDFIAQYPAEGRRNITRQLTERAHWLLSRAPKDAVSVSRLAVHFAKSILGATDAERDERVELEADALREHAHALLTIEDFETARIAADEATFLYGLLVSAEEGAPTEDGSLLEVIVALIPAANTNERTRERLDKAAVHGLILGQILAGQGDVQDGLLLIEQCANVLLSCCRQNKKYVQGRTIYAKILAERRRCKEALEVLEGTAAVAKDLHDNETLAHLVNNIGYCYYYYLGNAAKAKSCLEIALQMFEELGLETEALRPRNILAALLMEEGDENRAAYSRAISELFMSRAHYLSAGLPSDAARVMLRIIRAFILSGRQRDINWEEINHTFGAAGLRADVVRALQHLEQLAASCTLTVSDVDDAEAILDLGTDASSEVQEAG